MATRTIQATLDTFSVDAGSEITYLGPTTAGNKGDAVRGFRVNPGSTGDIKVTLDRSEGVNTIEIFKKMHLQQVVLLLVIKSFLI